MDTDSSYFALAEDSLEKCIHPHLKREFYEQYDHWFPTLSCPAHKNAFISAKLKNQKWLLQECCRKAYMYDKRTPGKFKIEFEGEGIIALCSKTYYCFGGSEGDKLSCKGLQKKRNKNNLTKKAYLRVLKEQESGYGINKGFIAKKGRVCSYEQKRFGLSYMYCKRWVLDDGVSTKSLDL